VSTTRRVRHVVTEVHKYSKIMTLACDVGFLFLLQVVRCPDDCTTTDAVENVVKLVRLLLKSGAMDVQDDEVGAPSEPAFAWASLSFQNHH
jgi:hypothetical protein